MEPENLSSQVESQPADQRDQTAKKDVGSIMPRHRGREALLGKFPPPGAGNPDDSYSAKPSNYMDRRRAARIQETVAETKIRAELGEPSTRPHPVGKKRKNNTSEDSSTRRSELPKV